MLIQHTVLRLAIVHHINKRRQYTDTQQSGSETLILRKNSSDLWSDVDTRIQQNQQYGTGLRATCTQHHGAMIAAAAVLSVCVCVCVCVCVSVIIARRMRRSLQVPPTFCCILVNITPYPVFPSHSLLSLSIVGAVCQYTAYMMDYSSMKHSIVPRMVFLCLNTESIAVSKMS